MLTRLRDLLIKQSGSEGGFSIIYVEISDYELRTMWRRLKNKIRYSGHYRHIVLLKRIHKQVKLRQRINIYKTKRIHSDRILAVSPKI